MKRRMRYYIRQGWTCVELPADEVNVFHLIDNPSYDMSRTYHNIVSWCKQTFKPDEWQSRVGGGSGSEGVNRFVFKHSADATLFSLKWVRE